MNRGALVAAGSLAFVLVVACDSGASKQSVPAATPAPGVSAAAQPTATTAAVPPVSEPQPEGWVPESPLAGLVALADVAPYDTASYGSRVDSTTHGLGVVTLRWSAPRDTSSAAPRRTLWFRREPSAAARPVGALVLASPRDSAEGQFFLFAPPRTRRNLVEYENDGYGVPVDSLASGWARAILGWDSAGARIIGWADTTDTARVQVVRWVDHFRDVPLFFMNDRTARLYESLSDTLGAGALLPSIDRADYDLTMLETRGRWMRVTFTWPVARCGAEIDTTRTTSRTLWVPYQDPRGKLLVWGPHDC